VSRHVDIARECVLLSRDLPCFRSSLDNLEYQVREDERVERAALLATRDRYEAALRQIAALGESSRLAKGIAERALAAAQEGGRTQLGPANTNQKATE
jgi:hypothetical protein